MKNATIHFQKTKVWITFFIILGVVITAVLWSYQSYQKLTGSINQLSEPNEKNVLIQNTIQSINKSDNYIKSYILTDKRDFFHAYKSEVKNIRLNIKRMKIEMGSDRVLLNKIDSLNILFIQKQKYLNDFLTTKRQRQAKNFSTEALEKITQNTSDSTEIQVGVRTRLKTTEEFHPIVKQSFVETEYRAPGFWEGLKRIFGTKNIRIDTINVIENDTIRAVELILDTFNIANYQSDSMLLTVKQILQEAANNELKSQSLLSAKELSLLQQDMRLHTEIDKIIQQLQQYEEENSKKRRNESYLITRKSTQVLLGIGIAATIIGGFFLFAISRDLTRSYYLSRRLELEKNKANRLARVKEDFLANMSHEIRTPLNSILGFSQLIGKTKLDRSQQVFSNALSENTNYLIGLINDILDFSKLNVNKIELSQEPFQIKDVVLQMESLFSLQCEKKGIEFKTSFDPRLENLDLIGDEFRFSQILTNLLSNAVKFTEKGSVELKINGEKGRSLYYLNIIVSDTGKGIDTDKYRSIFNSFEQEDASVTKKFGGTGLGLSIVKKLVEAMKGVILVESEINNYTRFTARINLPYQSHERKESNMEVEQSKETKYDGHLVIIEDDHWNSILIKSMLKDKVRQITVFRDPEKALVYIIKHADSIDLVMTDINMPKISGIDVLKSLKEQMPTLPVVAMTAHILPEMVKQFSDLGFDRVITKPFKEETIFATLQEYMSGSEELQRESKRENGESNGEKDDEMDFNFDKIIQFTGKDEELLGELVIELTENNAKNVDQFIEFLDKGDLQRLADLSHKMVQTYDSLSLVSIAENLKAMEVNFLLGKSESMIEIGNKLVPKMLKIREQLAEIKPQYYT